MTAADGIDLLHSYQCGKDPGPLTLQQARTILTIHAGHGPKCRQYLDAMAQLSEVMG